MSEKKRKKGKEAAVRARVSSDQLRRRFNRTAHRAANLIANRHPRILGVLVNGSVGRGEPQPYSDIDLLAVTRGGRTPDWFSYLDDGIHVAVGFVTLKEFRGAASDSQRFFWARGGARSARVLKDPHGLLKKVLQEKRRVKATPSIVETIAWHAYRDIVEYGGKLKNGWILQDEYLIRYSARIIAEKSQEVILALNDISPLSENLVWDDVMKAKKRPDHFLADYPVSLGMRGKASTSRVFTSALRLAGETLEEVRKEFHDKARNRHFLAFMDVSSEDFVRL